MKKKREPKDPIIEEFLKKDLGEDIRRAGTLVRIRPKWKQTATSLLLSPELIEKLRAKADKRGIGYQTMLKIIVHEHIDEY